MFNTNRHIVFNSCSLSSHGFVQWFAHGQNFWGMSRLKPRFSAMRLPARPRCCREVRISGFLDGMTPHEKCGMFFSKSEDMAMDQ